MPGGDIRRSAPPIVCTLLAAHAACFLRPQDPPGSGASATDVTTGPQTTTSAPDTTSATDDPVPTSGGSSDDPPGSFIMTPDGGHGHKECDPWTENCPEGQKCVPFSGDGDNTWESVKCVDVVPDPDGPGEPCTAFGSGVSGEDSCDKHAVCWDIDFPTLTGTCVAMCIGSPDAPACADPDTLGCLVSSEGVLILCLPQCDPLVQDCDPGEMCAAYDDRGFACTTDLSVEGQAFAPCQAPWHCDPGLHCAEPALAIECDPRAYGCCLPFCDTDAPAACPGVDQQCVPWYADPAEAATFNADLGLCRLP